ncbi:MAG: hypothetical protein ACI9MC_001031 [Kiritimatiellia bacterium]|jgi:hypothetical protein
MRTISLLPLLLCQQALASDLEAENLSTMRTRYGLAAVVSVLQAASSGDVSNTEAHVRLRELGLIKLTVPVRVDSALTAHLKADTKLRQCGWNDGVYCSATFTWTQGPTPWHVMCDAPDGTVLQGQAEDLSTPGVPQPVHVGDVVECWKDGVDGVRIVAGPAPLVIDADKVFTATVEGRPAEPVLRTVSGAANALASCPGPPGVGGRVALTWTINPTGEPQDVIAHSSIADDALHTCLTDVVAGLQFEPVPVSSTVIYPLDVYTIEVR